MGVPHLLDLPIDPEISARADSGTIEGYENNLYADKIEAISNATEWHYHLVLREITNASAELAHLIPR